jgi:HPt (histidine-containing phosphotransfer) domain-containing protein
MPRDDDVNDALAILSGGSAARPEDPVPERLGCAPLHSALRPAAWSKSDVLERLGEDEDLLREMCGIFLTESASLLEKLRQAIAGGEAAAVMRAAHSLKGEVSYLSAPAAAEAARRLEDMGHQRDISQAPEALALLEREMEVLCRSIREFAGVEP